MHRGVQCVNARSVPHYINASSTVCTGSKPMRSDVRCASAGARFVYSKDTQVGSSMRINEFSGQYWVETTSPREDERSVRQGQMHFDVIQRSSDWKRRRRVVERRVQALFLRAASGILLSDLLPFETIRVPTRKLETQGWWWDFCFDKFVFLSFYWDFFYIKIN